jgi:hypothetical protein
MEGGEGEEGAHEMYKSECGVDADANPQQSNVFARQGMMYDLPEATQRSRTLRDLGRCKRRCMRNCNNWRREALEHDGTTHGHWHAA